jgi:hypothetical protein
VLCLSLWVMVYAGFRGTLDTTRVKVEGTIEKIVFEEFRKIYQLEIERAEAEDKAAPSTSRVLEMLVRKGIKTYKREVKDTR